MMSTSFSSGTVPFAARFWRETEISLLAADVGEPAAARASTSVIAPVIMILPGVRTSPLTMML